MDELYMNFCIYNMLLYAYFEKTDPTASIGTSEMFIIIKVNVTQEPGVSKLLTSAIKPLIAAQMPSCEKNSKQWKNYYYNPAASAVKLKQIKGKSTNLNI